MLANKARIHQDSGLGGWLMVWANDSGMGYYTTLRMSSAWSVGYSSLYVYYPSVVCVAQQAIRRDEFTVPHTNDHIHNLAF